MEVIEHMSRTEEQACREAFAASFSVAVMTLDADGRVEGWNLGAERLFAGKPRPKTLSELFGPTFVTERTRLLRQAIERGERHTMVETIRGSLRTTTLFPFVDSLGKARILWVSELGVVPGVPRAQVDDLGVLEGLTSRERQMLTLLGSGMTNPQMAKALNRSVRTVHWHCASLCEKLGKTRQELARLAVEHGLAQARH